MTHQEFFDLRVGDEVCISVVHLYCGAKIIETKTNGLNECTTYIKVKENTNENTHIIKRQNGIWWFGDHGIDSACFEPKFITLIKKKEDMNQDKITEAKNEIARLEKLVKTLEAEKKLKELKEQISKLIPGNFYTVKTNDSMTFTGRFSNFNNHHQIFFTHPEVTTTYGFGIDVIKEIIHRPDFTNEFNNLMKKLETYNKEI